MYRDHLQAEAIQNKVICTISHNKRTLKYVHNLPDSPISYLTFRMLAYFIFMYPLKCAPADTLGAQVGRYFNNHWWSSIASTVWIHCWALMTCFNINLCLTMKKCFMPFVSSCQHARGWYNAMYSTIRLSFKFWAISYIHYLVLVVNAPPVVLDGAINMFFFSLPH